MIYRVDIDETICISPKDRDYTKAIPIPENIAKINKLYDGGHTIIYWTARGSRTKIDWTDVTVRQLADWGVKYHDVKLDKPYYDFFIDDRNLRIEEI